MNKWDDIWSRSNASGPWSVPDPELEELIPGLQREGVSRALDLGCGMGRHTILLSAAGFDTYAVDASEQAVVRCREWLESCELKAKVFRSPMTTLGFPDDHFGFVVSWNVVYQAVRADIVAALGEIHRVMDEYALLYLTLNSTRNGKYGKGTEIEPDTFDDPDRGHGHHIHHYSSRDDAADLLSRWRIESMIESEEWLGGKVHANTWHWMVLARKRTD